MYDRNVKNKLSIIKNKQETGEIKIEDPNKSVEVENFNGGMRRAQLAEERKLIAKESNSTQKKVETGVVLSTETRLVKTILTTNSRLNSAHQRAVFRPQPEFDEFKSSAKAITHTSKGRMANSTSVDKIRNIHRSSNLYRGKTKGSYTSLRINSAYSDFTSAKKVNYLNQPRPGSTPANILGSGNMAFSGPKIKIETGGLDTDFYSGANSVLQDSCNDSRVLKEANSKSKIRRVMSAVTKNQLSETRAPQISDFIQIKQVNDLGKFNRYLHRPNSAKVIALDNSKGYKMDHRNQRILKTENSAMNSGPTVLSPRFSRVNWTSPKNLELFKAAYSSKNFDHEYANCGPNPLLNKYFKNIAYELQLLKDAKNHVNIFEKDAYKSVLQSGKIKHDQIQALEHKKSNPAIVQARDTNLWIDKDRDFSSNFDSVITPELQKTANNYHKKYAADRSKKASRSVVNTSNEMEDIKQHIKKIQQFKFSIPENKSIGIAERNKASCTTKASYKRTIVTPTQGEITHHQKIGFFGEQKVTNTSNDFFQ